MTKDINRGSGQGEEIEGAPPVISTAELAESRLTETLTINRYLYQQTQQLELMLLQAQGLQALFEILLVSMPRHYSFRTSELWLYDPDDVLSKILVGAERYGTSLQLLSDVFPIQELYELEPDIALIDATDSRMFEILKSEHGVEYALLMPLTDSGRLIGSLHLGLQDDSLVLGEQEEHLLAHLAALLSSCFKSAVSRQQVSQLTLLDPLTEASNPRGFGREIAREISRARRSTPWGTRWRTAPRATPRRGSSSRRHWRCNPASPLFSTAWVGCCFAWANMTMHSDTSRAPMRSFPIPKSPPISARCCG